MASTRPCRRLPTALPPTLTRPAIRCAARRPSSINTYSGARAPSPDRSLRAYSLAVVGAGIVGLATSRELLNRRPGLRLAVIEKEPRVGAHQSGHNSGVIHSGIYYAPGSLKARLCVAGARE